LTSQEVAQRQQQQGHIRNITLSDVMPSGQFKTLDHSAFQMSYPDNWELFGDANSAVTISPRVAVAENAIAYGAIVNGIRTQSGESLDQATSELVDSLRQSNPGLRVDGSLQELQVNGVPARSVYLLSKSPLQGSNSILPERDWLVTIQRPDNSILYLVFIAPARDFERLARTYEQMLRSLQLK
jgi:beta-barrel assembly-enhancing protease